MRRFVIALAATAAPALACISLTGCGDEVKTHQTSERIEQTEPRMVAPGTEVLVPDQVQPGEPRMVSPGTEVLVPDRVEQVQ